MSHALMSASYVWRAPASEAMLVRRSRNDIAAFIDVGGRPAATLGCLFDGKACYVLMAGGAALRLFIPMRPLTIFRRNLGLGLLPIFLVSPLWTTSGFPEMIGSFADAVLAFIRI